MKRPPANESPLQVDRLSTDRLNRPAPSTVVGTIRVAIIAMGLTLCGGGIAIGDTRTDVWPEVNLFHQIDDRYRLHLLARSSGHETSITATAKSERIWTLGRFRSCALACCPIALFISTCGFAWAIGMAENLPVMIRSRSIGLSWR